MGEKVSYYSSSHGAWMPARIVERKSRSGLVRRRGRKHEHAAAKVFGFACTADAVQGQASAREQSIPRRTIYVIDKQMRGCLAKATTLC